jgi:chemotaxis protein CheD
MDKIIKINLAEVKTATNPHILVTPSVGSCVVVILYDELTRIGSMGHIMLPDIDQAKSKENKARFANTAVEIMLEQMTDIGAVRGRIKAKIAGGANMFPTVNRGSELHIGLKNILAVRDELKKRKIRLVAEDTEGNYGRCVEFFLETGVVRTKSALHGNREI